ncbi:MAG: hypothetical protein QXE31_00050 [Candidatus Woesearchaeota archaeon]
MHSEHKENTNSKTDFDIFSEEIKKLELDAENIINEAYRKKEEFIAKAKTESIELIKKKEAEYLEKKHEYLEKEKKLLDDEKEKKLKNSEKELKDLETKAIKKIDSAAKYVIELMNNEIDNI